MTSIWDDPVFKAGDKVICQNARGYYTLTEGETYEVKKYEAKCPDQHFTWPAYVEVKVSRDRTVWSHARRFRKVEDT